MPSGELVRSTNNTVSTEEKAKRNTHANSLITLPEVLMFHSAHYLTPQDIVNLMLTCKNVRYSLRCGPGQFYLHAVLTRKKNKDYQNIIEHAYKGDLQDKGMLSNQSYQLILSVQGESTEAKTYQQLLTLFSSSFALPLLTGQAECFLKAPQTEQAKRLRKAFEDGYSSALKFRNLNLKQIPLGFKKHHSLYYLHTLNVLAKLVELDDTDEVNIKKIAALCYLRDNIDAVCKLYENTRSKKAKRACIDTFYRKASATRRRGEYWAAFFMALGLLFGALSICGFALSFFAPLVYLGVAVVAWVLVGCLSLLPFVALFKLGLWIFDFTELSFKQAWHPNTEDAVLPVLHEWQNLHADVMHDNNRAPPRVNPFSFFSITYEESTDDEKKEASCSSNLLQTPP